MVSNKHTYDAYRNSLCYAVLFDNVQQQDAHEFLNYLLNTIGDLLAGISYIVCVFYDIV